MEAVSSFKAGGSTVKVVFASPCMVGDCTSISIILGHHHLRTSQSDTRVIVRSSRRSPRTEMGTQRGTETRTSQGGSPTFALAKLQGTSYPYQCMRSRSHGSCHPASR